MEQRVSPKITFAGRPLHSETFRSSIPDGVVMDASKAGAIVAMSSAGRLAEIERALEGLGLLVAGCTTREELTVFFVRSIERPDVRIPEVLVVDAAILAGSTELVEILRKANCLDSMIVILPESWPRGTTPPPLDCAQVLQEPFPMTVLVEEVAQRMTPSSVGVT